MESVNMLRMSFVLGLIYLQFPSIASYNILGIFPVRAYSHFVVLNSISKELAYRGHNVTIYTKFKETYQSENFRHIELADCFPLKNDNFIYNSVEYVSSYSGKIGFLLFILNFIPSFEELKTCKSLMDIVNTKDKYDVLLLEAYNGNTDIFAGLSYKLNLPYIAVSTTMLYPWLSERIGTPDNPSYIPVPFSGYTSNMNFEERLLNTLTYLLSKLIYNYKSIPQSEAVAKQLFGENMPPLKSVLENCSLMFTYTHNSINPIRPLVPNVVEIAGINIGESQPLPQDVEKFINESEHGVIYFSMGSFLHSKMLPKQILNAFLKAFSKIPQRIVWKWEGKPTSIKSNKIFTAPWLPQKDILDHPNVKLFISHGGLLGMNEAVSAGVPVLGIPIFADQLTNVKSLKERGAAEILLYEEITEEIVFAKITQILSDTRYKENAEILSIRYKDRPLSPQDTVVYWTEYVVRHGGAHHLRSPAADMPFYQYLLLDVVVFILIAFIVFFVTVFYTFKLWFLMIKKLFLGNCVPDTSVKAKQN